MNIKLAKRHGLYIIGFVVCLLLAWQSFRYWQGGSPSREPSAFASDVFSLRHLAQSIPRGILLLGSQQIGTFDSAAVLDGNGSLRDRSLILYANLSTSDTLFLYEGSLVAVTTEPQNNRFPTSVELTRRDIQGSPIGVLWIGNHSFMLMQP
jgi:hypothetical protein